MFNWNSADGATASHDATIPWYGWDLIISTIGAIHLISISTLQHVSCVTYWIGGRLFALLMKTIVSSDGAMCSFGFNSLTIRTHQYAGHHAQRPKPWTDTTNLSTQPYVNISQQWQKDWLDHILRGEYHVYMQSWKAEWRGREDVDNRVNYDDGQNKENMVWGTNTYRNKLRKQNNDIIEGLGVPKEEITLRLVSALLNLLSKLNSTS